MKRAFLYLFLGMGTCFAQTSVQRTPTSGVSSTGTLSNGGFHVPSGQTITIDPGATIANSGTATGFGGGGTTFVPLAPLVLNTGTLSLVFNSTLTASTGTLGINLANANTWTAAQTGTWSGTLIGSGAGLTSLPSNTSLYPALPYDASGAAAALLTATQSWTGTNTFPHLIGTGTFTGPVNGVALTTGGSSAQFLNGAGSYSTPSSGLVTAVTSPLSVATGTLSLLYGAQFSLSTGTLVINSNAFDANGAAAALLSATQSWTGTNTFSNFVGTGSFTGQSSGTFTGTVAHDATLTVTTGTLGLNLANANTWSGTQTFSAFLGTGTLTGHSTLDLALSGLGSGVQTALGNAVNGSGGLLTSALFGGTNTWTGTNIGNVAQWEVKSSNFTAVAGHRYLVDTSTGTVTATLPSTGAAGNPIELFDVTSSWSLNSLTIVPAGGILINGNTSNFIADGSNRDLVIGYDSSTWGWGVSHGKELGSNLEQNAVYLSNYRAAVAKVAAGTAACTVVALGDSTTHGSGATTGSGGLADGQPFCYPTQLAKFLNTQSIPANADSWMGDFLSSSSGSITLFDPRVTFGTGWIFWGPILGGNSIYCQTSGSNLSFAPLDVVDTIDIYYQGGTTSSFGSFTVNVDGGSTITTVNTNNGTALPAKATVTFPAGIHKINLVTSSTAAVYIMGEVARLSTKPAINVINAGAGGQTAAEVLANPFSSTWDFQTGMPVVAPNLTIINLGINDFRTGGSGTTLATWIATMQTIITTCKGSGDVLLCVPNNVANGVSPDTLWNANFPFMRAAIYSLAALNQCAVVDVAARFGSWPVANSAGLMYDEYHPNGLGYCDIAQYYAKALPTASGGSVSIAGIGSPAIVSTIPGINVKSTGTTTIYTATAPTGKTTFTVTSVILRTTATTGAAAGPTVSVSATTAGGIYASQAIGATNAVGQEFIFPNTGVLPSIGAGDTINLSVSVAGASTTDVRQCVIIGFWE